MIAIWYLRERDEAFFALIEDFEGPLQSLIAVRRLRNERKSDDVLPGKKNSDSGFLQFHLKISNDIFYSLVRKIRIETFMDKLQSQIWID